MIVDIDLFLNPLLSDSSGFCLSPGELVELLGSSLCCSEILSQVRHFELTKLEYSRSRSHIVQGQFGKFEIAIRNEISN